MQSLNKTNKTVHEQREKPTQTRSYGLLVVLVTSYIKKYKRPVLRLQAEEFLIKD